MDKNTFWQVIDEVNGKVPATDQDEIIRVTQEKLRGYSPQEIAVWANYQYYYNDLADTSSLFAASCCINGYVSEHGFIDFRMWLISQGKEVYLAALKDPDSLAILDIHTGATRFEEYGDVTDGAYETRDMSENEHANMIRYKLTEVQKAEIQAEIEYYPYQVTGRNLLCHLPNLYEEYMEPGAMLLFCYQPLFPSPAGTIESLTELEKLKNAALLIEIMSGSRFEHIMGGPFIYLDSTSDVCLAINMRQESDYGADLYRVSFDVNLQTMGKTMDAAGLMRLQEEVRVAYALLSALEMRDYTLTPEEMQEFNDFIREQEEQCEEQELPDDSVMDQPIY